MSSNFINIGNKVFIDANKVKFIMSADSDRVRKVLAKRKLKRTSDEVFDGTSDKETRSLLILDDNSFCISSVNATKLVERAKSDITELAANEGSKGEVPDK